MHMIVHEMMKLATALVAVACFLLAAWTLGAFVAALQGRERLVDGVNGRARFFWRMITLQGPR